MGVQSGNKAKIIPVILIITYLISGSALAQQLATATVRILPETLPVLINGTAEFAVEVEDATSLYAFDVTVSFDPELVEVVDADPDLDGIQVALGTFVDPGFVLINNADNEQGVLRFAMTQLNPSPPRDGTGVLIVITLRGNQAGGPADLVLERVQLATNTGIEIPVTLEDGELEVVTSLEGPTSTPIPTQGAGTPFPTRTPAPPTPTREPTEPPPTPTQTRTSPPASPTIPVTSTATVEPTFTASPTMQANDTPTSTTVPSQSTEISPDVPTSQAGGSGMTSPDEQQGNLLLYTGIGLVFVVGISILVLYFYRRGKTVFREETGEK